MRVRLAVAAPATWSRRCSIADAGQARDRRRRRRPRGARPRRRPARLAGAAPGPLLPEPRRHLRVASGAAAAPRRPADRRARRAAGRRRRRAPVVVVSAVALSEKVPDPSLRPHGFELRVGRADRPRRDRDGPRRGRLRARRPGRGPRPVRDPRRPARPLPGDRGPRRAGRPVRRRDRVAAVVLDLHPALARRRRGWSRWRRRPSWPPSTASWPRSRRWRTRRSGRTSPSCSRSSTSTRSWSWSARTRPC